MRRWGFCSIELALALALAACGPRSADPATGGTPSAEPRPPLSELALRTDHVRRLREMRAAMRRGDPRHLELDAQLAEALVALAKLHREMAIEADPKAASLPPPRDLSEPKEGVVRTGEEAEVDYPEVAVAERPELPRDDATFASLSPAARSHVRAADYCVREALDVLGPIEWMAGARPREPRKLAARQAELLDEIGQRTEARKKWLAVLRGDAKDALAASGYLAFAEWFAAKKDKETTKLFTKAAEAAAAAEDAKLLRRICDSARASGVDAPPPCIRP